MAKERLLYWILFVCIFIVNFLIYKFIYNTFIPWTVLTNIFSLFFLVIVILPLSVIIASKLTNYLLS